MAEDDLLKAMTMKGVTPAVRDWSELLRYYAKHLAVASEKLTEEEVYPLLAVGCMIFQRDLEDLREHARATGLFEKLRTKQEAESQKGK